MHNSLWCTKLLRASSNHAQCCKPHAGQNVAICAQIRHGAALALRGVLQNQAQAAGVLAPVILDPTGTLFFLHAL